MRPEDLEGEEAADGIKRYDKLTIMRATQTRELKACATTMRLTPQARYTPKGAGAMKTTPNPDAKGKPWEGR